MGRRDPALTIRALGPERPYRLAGARGGEELCCHADWGSVMTPNTSTYDLTLTTGQADYLLHLVTIAELAIGEHYRTGWLPTGHGDATLMQTHLQAIRSAASLEKPLRDVVT